MIGRRSRLRWMLAAFLCLVVTRVAPAQARTERYFIDSVTDSTLIFRVGPSARVKSGLTGVAVDPARRDALVARFKVLEVRDGRVMGLVTGQTTFVTTDHVAIVDVPPRSFWRQRLFWVGTLLGGALGAAAALSF